MADAVKMVVVNGVRYRPEDAPKQVAQEKDEKDEKAAEHKMRQPRKSTK